MALTGGYHRLTKEQGFEQRYYLHKDCKNKWKIETSRRRGWLIDPFMKLTFNVTAKDLLHSLGSYIEQLEVCIEKTFLLNR